MQNDPELWSGCISGALTEEGFLQAFSEAGFYGIQILKRDAQPWHTVEGIEFRSVTVEAFKGKQGPCFERNQAVIYKGPFREVLDDDNHRIERGKRYAVCDKTYNCLAKPLTTTSSNLLSHAPKSRSERRSLSIAIGPTLRHPKETKGADDGASTGPSQCCDSGSCA